MHRLRLSVRKELKTWVTVISLTLLASAAWADDPQSEISVVLPTTLAPDVDGGSTGRIEFTRVIVHPNGHREIEGVTPKALPAPDGDKDQ